MSGFPDSVSSLRTGPRRSGTVISSGPPARPCPPLSRCSWCAGRHVGADAVEGGRLSPQQRAAGAYPGNRGPALGDPVVAGGAGQALAGAGAAAQLLLLLHQCPRRAEGRVVARRHQQRDLPADQRRGDRGREPPVGMDQVGLRRNDQSPQAPDRHRVGVGRLMALATIADENRQESAKLLDPMYLDPVLHGHPRQTAAPRRRNRHLMPASAHSLGKELRLTLGAPDEGRVVIGR